MTPSDPFIEAIAEAVARKLAGMMKPPVDQKLIDIKEAARYMGRTAPSLRGMIASDEVPKKCIKRIGSRVFLVKPELDAWIDAQ